jgi:hypothetical protein
MTVRWYTQPPTKYTSTAISMMTLKTPLGPSACVAWCTPPHAKGDRPSKKYVHSSTAATNDTLVLASGSESQRSEITVVLRRAFLSSLSLSEEGFFLGLSSSSSSSPSMISRGALGRETGSSWRLDLEELEGHSEPPV